jgi:uncharacterized protein
VFEVNSPQQSGTEYVPFSPINPLKKSKTVTTLKIQLGLSCNYSCEYCSQRFVERAEETTNNDIFLFMARLKNLNFDEDLGLKIEFWGGEPFVYWKTLKPLVAALKEKFSTWKIPPRYSIITNGSLLTPEINQWIIDNMDGGAISHDGPGQHVRGPDPFIDPEKKQLALDLYKAMDGKFSFNSMLNAQNISRLKIYEWFVDFTGDPEVRLGEGGLVDAYDDGGISLSLNTEEEHYNFRKIAFSDLFSNINIGFGGIQQKINSFIYSVLNHNPATVVHQKCGMDNEFTLAVDLKGNVLTCQNVSNVAINSNGEPHLSGNILDMDNVAITTSTHWSERKECSQCPVLHICKGSCMYVSGEYWHHSCSNAYSDAVVLFAIAFLRITNYIPVSIDSDTLPIMRKDIWGTEKLNLQ